jgi:hypothetical protein
MTNARCLTEGVDLPAIDCVVFTDPKKSKVDIVQAAGRALRLSPGKKFGYILIPLIIPENENATEAAKDTAFEEIVATIRALATQDSRIIEYLRAVSSGTIPKGGSPVDGITKINVLTKVNEEEFNKSIQLKVWDRVVFGNWRTYEEAKKYAQSLKLKSRKQWYNHTKSKNFPKDIPIFPPGVYQKEFEGMGIFLGTGRIASKFIKFRSLEEAKKYASNLNLNSNSEWTKHTKSKNFPTGIPKAPQHYYKKKWISWSNFLGKDFLSYSVTKKYAQTQNLKGQNDWNNHVKKRSFPKNMRKNPAAYKEFISWGDFLGTNYVATKKRKYKTYIQLKKFLRSKNIKSRNDWISYYNKNKKKLLNLPYSIETVYKKNWEGWGTLLGTGNKYKKS